MKKEHEKVIENMLADIRQIPGFISGLGARSATLESYIHAAKDLQEAHEHEVMILDAIIMSEKFGKTLKRPGVDRGEIQGMIEYYESDIEKHARLLHEFIEERKYHNWN